MKTKRNLIIGCMTLLCSACSNYLDIKPYGRTIPKTAEEFSALIHNRLNTIDEGSDRYLVGNASQYITWDAACGDDFETCLTGSGARSLDTYVGNIVGTSSYQSYYQTLYEYIRDCNIVLNEMKETGTEESDKIRAAAYAIRGVSYYQLLRLFCEAPRTGEFNQQLGVPIITTFDMEEKALRSSMQVTIEQIENDLIKSAEYHLTDDVYRFTEDVVKGYLTRLYFWTEQWDKALLAAQDMLKKYPLLQPDAYKDMMNEAYALKGNQLIKAYRTISSSSSSELSGVNSTLKYRPVSRRFLSTFTDEEKTTDVRYAMCVNSQRQANKVFFCGMRAAEFKLIEAECYYHLNQPDKALKSINDLRAHRIAGYTDITESNLPEIPELEIIKTDAKGNNLTPLLALILTERRKELFMEGDRFFEQKRNGTPEYWTALNGLKYVTESYMYTFPIPTHDLDLNNGLKQNPGYTEFANE